MRLVNIRVLPKTEHSLTGDIIFPKSNYHQKIIVISFLILKASGSSLNMQYIN